MRVRERWMPLRLSPHERLEVRALHFEPAMWQELERLYARAGAPEGQGRPALLRWLNHLDPHLESTQIAM
ncbi:hypothetical protein HNR42_001265 [Deinobacterium chartae]|uniref:Uncharacterized protein n=1 Tax=Deinobacterium chartae TaxID=521158 RepID=A0A841I189_9DEIO|nr:hypothetical protein [Deinobacterium chartae]MBB6097842.1 hypothetical protein [Deinobacterium chartae]